jgi:hypothetical protein
VLQYAGATFPKRDTIDSRIVYETQSGTVAYGGKTYAKAQGFDTTKVYGIIDSQTDVGGWPVLMSSAAPLDSDHDGMPDSWEITQGLDWNNAADRNKIGAGGYTMLEIYLNSLVGNNPSTTTAIHERDSQPVGFTLNQNYPNPFNPSTNIEYRISKLGFVTLKVFDILGREVATLVNGELQPGSYHATFDASHLASGVYMYQLRTEAFIQTQRMVLTK